MARCPDCPVPGGECRGEILRNLKCDDPAYRAAFARIASGQHEEMVGARHFANAARCPRREPIPEPERVGCGCSHRCTAGQSPRPDGTITVLDCWACPIAPRLDPAADDRSD